MPKLSPKILFTSALILVLIGIGLIISRQASPEPPSTRHSEAHPIATTEGETTAGHAKKEESAHASKRAPEPEVNMEAVMNEIDDATTTYSTEAIPILERYLNSQNPEIRKAAANGLAQMGLSEGAPALHAAATRLQVSHPDEAKEYEETAKFLELPDGSANLKKIADGAKKAMEEGKLKPQQRPPKIIDGQPQGQENSGISRAFRALRQKEMEQQQQPTPQETPENP
jgi:HEAT repeats